MKGVFCAMLAALLLVATVLGGTWLLLLAEEGMLYRGLSNDGALFAEDQEQIVAIVLVSTAALVSLVVLGLAAKAANKARSRAAGPTFAYTFFIASMLGGFPVGLKAAWEWKLSPYEKFEKVHYIWEYNLERADQYQERYETRKEEFAKNPDDNPGALEGREFVLNDLADRVATYRERAAAREREKNRLKTAPQRDAIAIGIAAGMLLIGAILVQCFKEKPARTEPQATSSPAAESAPTAPAQES